MEKIRYAIACYSYNRFKKGEKGFKEYDAEYFDSLINSFLYFEDYEKCTEARDDKHRLFGVMV